jgi:hypothetical protein
MPGIARVVAGAAGKNAGSTSGTGLIVLALYGGIFVFALISWIAWGIRQERGGIIQWGETRNETFGQKLAQMWKAASAPPKSPYEAPAPDQFIEDEADERERTAG